LSHFLDRFLDRFLLSRLSHKIKLLYYNQIMPTSSQSTSQFLSLRLDSGDAALMRALSVRTGLSKTEIVKLALRKLANETQSEVSLFDMGSAKFGLYGDASRQSSQVKAIVRERLLVKRKRQASNGS
jgi:hypothetical protein